VSQNELSVDERALSDFFEFLYGAENGYVYVAHKAPGMQLQFQQTFFEWPRQRQELIAHVVDKRPRFEVYTAPALFREPSAKKEHIKGARVFWCEFDGFLPPKLDGVPEPSVRIQSSTADHEHWYWLVGELVETAELERVNRAITYLLGADTSGWDAGQILRPPRTLNHKRQRAVELLDWSPSRQFPRVVFDGLPEPPPLVEAPLPERIPPIEDVVLKYRFPEQAIKLFRKGVGADSHKRSGALMSLGFYLAEAGLSNEEILAMLLNADQRWGKFYGRADRDVRLMEIVTIARQKFPERNTDGESHTKLQALGFLSLLKTNVHVEWIWDGWLQKHGYMCLTGPSGVGKTQVSLDVAAKIALGQPALDAPCSPVKLGFFSLEMNLPELKYFLELQKQGYSQEELELLEKNFQIFPLGEPLYLSRPEVREQVEQVVGDLKLDGIVVDSMGSSTDGSLSDETAVKSLMDWNDRFRQRLGAFTWFIHHHRKASGENKRPNKLSDVYGNQYITARATSVVCLWDSGIANTLEFIPLKVRLRANPGKFRIKRSADLHYTRMVNGIVDEKGDVILTDITLKDDGEEQQKSVNESELGGSFTI